MKVVILGIQGSGKTYLAQKYFLDNEPNHIVFDINDEYPDDYIRYVPHKKTVDDYELLSEETKLFVKRVVFPNIWSIEQVEKAGKDKNKRLKLIVFDEADLIMPARKLFNSALHNLWVKSRHYRVDLVVISRRPTDLNTYVMDTADYLIVFNIPGHNAMRVLKDINAEAEKVIKSLDYNKHEFVIFNRAREYQKMTLEGIMSINLS